MSANRRCSASISLFHRLQTCTFTNRCSISLHHFILAIFLCLNPFSIRAARIGLTLFIICSLAPLAFAPMEWAAEMKFRLSDPRHLYPPSMCVNSEGPDWNSAPRLATCQVSQRTLFRAECRWRHKERAIREPTKWRRRTVRLLSASFSCRLSLMALMTSPCEQLLTGPRLHLTLISMSTFFKSRWNHSVPFPFSVYLQFPRCPAVSVLPFISTSCFESQCDCSFPPLLPRFY